MPHITTAISLSDGQATPVARSFTPQSLGMTLSRFAYKKIAAKFGWVFFDVKWSDSTPKRPTVRQEISIEMPIVRPVAGVDTKVSTARAFTTFVIPDEMTEDEIKDMRAFLIAAQSNGNISVGSTQREPLWG